MINFHGGTSLGQHFIAATLTTTRLSN